MKTIKLRHTKECNKANRRWRDNNFCRGDGACGSSMCVCDVLNEMRITAHQDCERTYKKKLIEGQQVPDGKSLGAGE